MADDGFKRFERKDDGIEIIVDIRTCGLGLGEVMRMIEEYRNANPERDVWLDGDMYAVVSKTREAEA